MNLVLPLTNAFYSVIISKFIQKENDVLDLRGIVWEQTIKSAGLFGRGRDFFETETVAAALNTFISMLGMYGWIPLIIFVIYLAFYFTKSFSRAFMNIDDKYLYLPILMLLTFVFLSVAESMMMKSSMLAVFALYVTNRQLKHAETSQ